MGLLDSLLQDGTLLGDLTNFASENPQILEAALSLLSERQGTVGGSGGLGALLASLREGGLGELAASWLGTGANRAVAPDQLGRALGGDTLAEFAKAAGIGSDQAPSVLAGILPELVNQLSPQGRAPETGSLDAMLGGLLKTLRA